MFDSKGFLWVSTNEGLHRYDGKHIVRFLPNPKDSNAIRSQNVLSLAEDKLGRIFLGGKAIEVFLPEENRFQIISDEFHEYYQPGPPIWIFDEDQIGIAMTIKGPLVFSLDSLLPVANYSLLPASIQNFIQQLTSTKDKIPAQLLHDSGSHPKMLNNPGIVSFRSAGQDLWLATHRPSGFVCIGENLEVEWKSLEGLSELIDFPAALTFLNYNDSLAIAGVEGFGLVLFNKESKKIIRHWDFRHSHLLSRVNWINPLCTDPGGRVWFSIMAYGLYVLDPFSSTFLTLQSSMLGSVLYHGFMTSMHCDDLGRLWIGFHDGVLQILDTSLQKEVFRKQILSMPFGHNRSIHSIVSLPGGDVLINGQLRFSIGRVPDEPPRPPEIIGLRKFHGHPFNTITTPTNIVLMGIDSTATLIFHNEDGQYKLTTNQAVYGPECTFITDQQYLLVHFYGYYSDLYAIHQNQLSLLRHYESDPAIKTVYQPPGADSLWIGKATGLSVLDLCTFTMHDVNVEDWPSKYIYGILPDDKGYLWMSTNAGIVRYHPSSGQWRNFNVNDGMQSNEFNTNCYAKMKDGTLVFGGPGGLNAFDPAFFDSKKTSFRVHFTNVQIDGVKEPTFNPYKRNSIFTLYPGDKSIEFAYSSTQFSDREDLTYYIQLYGVDAGWVKMDDKEFVRYVNLKPGSYTFRIKAQNADGYWSNNVEEAGVIVIPAYYQAIWFKGLLMLLTAALIYALYLYRVYQLRKLWQFRNRISNDLHDDVGSTLGSISIYSEVAKRAKGVYRDDVLDKIGDASREMLEKLNDIVWTINPENDSLEKMESRIRNYASMMLHPKGINFTLTVRVQNHALMADMNMRKNLFLIVKEALHNAAKYAGCKHINLCLEDRQGRIFVEIADDGKGFDPKDVAVYNGHGLKSMQDRATSIGAHLQIASRPGQGTVITLES